MNNTLDLLINTISYLALSSVAVERITDIVKIQILQRISLLVKYSLYGSMITIVSVTAGILIAYMSPPQNSFVHNTFIIGLLCSGGSSMWHEILNVLTGFRRNLAEK